jgi:hypothetical protein
LRCVSSKARLMRAFFLGAAHRAAPHDEETLLRRLEP